MFTHVNDFLKIWKDEADSTIKVLKTLTDSSLSQKVYAEGRTLGFIAWHITITIGEMSALIGLKVDCPTEDTPEAEDAGGIVKAYETAAKSLFEEIERGMGDDDLEKEDDMYGESWKRGYTLYVLVSHQTHHRGQMTVLMRQAGLPVPGVCGPSKEEWSAFGVPAAK